MLESLLDEMERDGHHHKDRLPPAFNAKSIKRRQIPSRMESRSAAGHSPRTTPTTSEAATSFPSAILPRSQFHPA